MITWTQIGIHAKRGFNYFFDPPPDCPPAIVILNVLGFYDPLKDLIRSGVKTGFIQPSNEHIVVFIDGPSQHSEHGSYDWGTAAIEALNSWKFSEVQSYGFDWKKRLPGEREKTSPLDVS